VVAVENTEKLATDFSAQAVGREGSRTAAVWSQL